MTRRPPADQSIRSYLSELESSGDVLRVTDPVDRRFEMSAFLALADGGPAVVFENVIGSDVPAVGNLLATRARVGAAMGVDTASVFDRLVLAASSGDAPVPVACGPVHEVVERRVDLARLPLPVFFERETGPYLTAGMIVARDPHTGQGNASFARLKPLGPDRAFVGIAPNHHLNRMARAAGAPLEIAVVVGAHPAIQLAACLYLDLGDDELHHAAPLLGERVRTVRACTVDLDVPADAELVLEGTLRVDEPVHEGLVSEFHGLYEDYGAGSTVHLTCLTRRHDALMQIVQPGWFGEHLYLAALPIAAGLKRAVAQAVPSVHDLAVTEGGAGRTSVVVSLADPKPGHAHRAMFACWAAVNLVRSVTVVDADVDVWDPVQVEWARTTTVRWERDLVVVPGAGADRSDPMEQGGRVTKVGVDATRSAGDRVEGFERALPSEAAIARARAWLATNSPATEIRHPWMQRRSP